MTLQQVISASEFSGLTDAECVTVFGETVEVSRDETAYNWKGLGNKLREKGLTDAQLVGWNTAIEGLPGCDIFREMLRSDGIDLTDTTVRSLIAYALATNEDETAEAALTACLDIGIHMGPLWEKYGLSGLPTEAEVAAARQSNQNQQDAASLLNECINPLVAQGASLAEIKTAVAAWGE